MYRRLLVLLGAIGASFTFSFQMASAGQGARAIEEIIVTARRREEEIQTVPVAVSVISQETIDRRGFMDGLHLGAMVPNMTSESRESRHIVLFNIRGQSYTYGNLFSAVIPYFAEMPVTGGPFSPGISQGVFFDLESAQVLRGPQGTLFGRVTDGGSILLQPRRPDKDSVNGYAEVNGGDYDRRGFKAALNIPLGDTLAVRIAGESLKRDGFTKNRSTGKKADDVDYVAGRVGILWQPTDRFENYFVWNHFSSDTNHTGVQVSGYNRPALEANVRGLIAGFVDPTGTNPAAVDAAVRGVVGVPGERGQIMDAGNAYANGILNPGGDTPTFYSALTAQQDAGVRSFDFGLHPEFGGHPSESPHFWRRRDNFFVNHTSFDINDKLTVKNILGYTKIRDRNATDFDGSEIVYVDTPHTFLPYIYQEQWSNETQLQGTGFADGTVDFILGAYFDEQKPAEKNGNENYTVNVLYVQRNDLQQPTTKSKAAFGQIGVDLSEWVDGLRFNGGLRYTEDKVDSLNITILELTGSLLPVFPPFIPAFPNGVPTPHGVCADYQSQTFFGPSICNNLKAKFDAWTWNVGFDYQINPDMMAYVAVRRGYRPGGFNSTSLGDQSDEASYDPEFDISTEIGLKADWNLGQVPARTNLAVFFDDYTDIQKTVSVTVNGAPASIISNTASASIWGVELEGTFFLTENLTFGMSYSYLDASFDSAPTDDVACSPDHGRLIAPSQEFFCTKNPFRTTPEHQFTANLRYTVPVGQLGQFSIGANYAWKDDLALLDNTWNLPDSWESSYGLLDIDASLTDIGGYPVDLSFFMTNVTDELYRIGTNDISRMGGLGERADYYGDPRMWGIALRYRLGE